MKAKISNMGINTESSTHVLRRTSINEIFPNPMKTYAHHKRRVRKSCTYVCVKNIIDFEPEVLYVSFVERTRLKSRHPKNDSKYVSCDIVCAKRKKKRRFC